VRARGFTLLEVMVALFILAVSAAALSRLAGQSSQATEQVQDRQLARWVAHNQMTLRRLGVTSASSGETQFAGRDFVWQISRSNTDTLDLYRYTLNVAAAEQPEYQLSELVALWYLSQ